MSERLPEPEQEPTTTIGINGEEYPIHRDNTTLYQHMGRYAMFDHAYIVLPTEPPVGVYIFNGTEHYQGFANWLIENEFPHNNNIRRPLQADIAAYERSIPTEDFDTIPESWME